MNVGDRDELLSAYLDREVTADERAEVEARLDASPDSRAELDALAELSLCLRTLDRPQAPTDFQTSVMQALAGRTIPTTPAVPRRKSRREWLVSIVAVATTTCLLLMAVSTNWNSPSEIATGNKYFSTEDRFGEIDELALTPAAMDDFATFRESATGSGGGNARFAKSLRSANGGGDVNFNFGTPATAEMKAAPVSAPAGVISDAEMAGATDQPTAAGDAMGRSLDKVPLNQVLELWAATGVTDQYVANIDVQVLDVKKSADSFQILLHNNGVVTLPLPDADESKQANGEVPSKLATVASRNGPVTASGDLSLVAVYVDTTADRVTKSLEELAQQQRVIDVSLQPFLPLARTPEEAGVALAKERAESLQRAEVEGLTQLYARQWQDFNDDDMDVPADALLTLNEAGRAKPDSVAMNRAKQIPNPKFNTKPGAPASSLDALKNKDFVDNAPVINNTLNYSSKLQLETAPIKPLDDLAEGLNTDGVGRKGLNTQADALQAGNLQRRMALRQNSDYGNNALVNNRQRMVYQNSANPVRVLVVFQDPPAETKPRNRSP